MRWIWVSGLAGVSIILASTMMWFGHEKFGNEQTADLANLSPAAGSTGQASIGGAFSLTDQNGNRVTAEDLKGKFSLVLFGFTFCPDVCPMSLNTVTEALKQIGPLAENIRPVFISVDPERDTPAVLKEYAASFDPHLLALSGTPEEIREVTDHYKVYYNAHKKSPSDKEYLVDHSSFIYLMGPDGEYLTHFAATIPASEMAVRLNEYISGSDAY